MKRLLLLPLLWILAPVCHAQGVPYAVTPPAPGARITVCVFPPSGNPCPNTQPIFSDAALSVSIAQPFDIGAGGNFLFYVAPGTYQIQISGRPDAIVTLGSVLPNGTGAGNAGTGIFDPTLAPYKAKADARSLQTSGASGNTINITSGSCTQADVGKHFFALNASGQKVFGDSVVNACTGGGTSLTLSTNCSTCSGGQSWIGTDNRSAFLAATAAMNAVSGNNKGVMDIPCGNYYTLGNLFPASGVWNDPTNATSAEVRGHGYNMPSNAGTNGAGCTNFVMSPFDDTTGVITIRNLSVNIHDISIDNLAPTNGFATSPNCGLVSVDAQMWNVTVNNCDDGTSACIGGASLDYAQWTSIRTGGCFIGIRMGDKPFTCVNCWVQSARGAGLNVNDSGETIISGQFTGCPAIDINPQGAGQQAWFTDVHATAAASNCSVVQVEANVGFANWEGGNIGGQDGCPTAPFNYDGIHFVGTTSIMILQGARVCASGVGKLIATGTGVILDGGGNQFTPSNTATFVATPPTVTWEADGHSVSGACTGVATAASTLGLYGTGPNITATTCTSATIGSGIVNQGTRTLENLIVTATAAGVNASSGVVTVLQNGAATTITCTIGTGTSCADGTHTVTLANGDRVSIQFTTQAADTLAGIKAFVMWN